MPVAHRLFGDLALPVEGDGYYTVNIDGHANTEAGWYYPSPGPRARQIMDHVAFCNGVRSEVDTEDHEDDAGASEARRLRSWQRGKQ